LSATSNIIVCRLGVNVTEPSAFENAISCNTDSDVVPSSDNTLIKLLSAVFEMSMPETSALL